MHTRIAAPALLTTALLATTARAGETPPRAGAAPNAAPAPGAATAVSTTPATPQVEVKSYGGQIVLADLATLGLAAAAGNGGLWLYPFAAPAVHLANGNGKGAAASLGLRTGLPIAGLVAGFLLAPKDRCSLICGPDMEDVLAVGLVGMLAASVIDATMVARIDRPIAPRALRHLPTPTVAVSRDGTFMMGAAGRF